jgi:hypothetical protein
MSDRLTQLDGVTTPAGTRHVQVRELTSESSGQEWTLFELFIIRRNGDWDYVSTVESADAMRWLIGRD